MRLEHLKRSMSFHPCHMLVVLIPGVVRERFLQSPNQPTQIYSVMDQLFRLLHHSWLGRGRDCCENEFPYSDISFLVAQPDSSKKSGHSAHLDHTSSTTCSALSMAKGRNRKNHQTEPDRGRGRGGGRGRGRGRGGGRGSGGSDFHQLDVVVQRWPEVDDSGERGSLR